MAQPKARKGIAAVLAAVPLFFAVIGGIAVFLMMLHVSADVLSKHFLNRPIVGTLEIVSHYYMVAVIFLPLAAIEQKREHIIVELFTARLSARYTRLLDGIACLLGAIFAGVIAAMSLLEAVRRTRSGEMIDAVYYEILVWPTRWLVPLGAGLFAIVLLLHAVRFLGGKGGDDAAEAEDQHLEIQQ